MPANLDQALSDISRLAKAERYDEAVELARQVLLQATDRRDEILAKLAYIRARQGNYELAVAHLADAIEINAREPDYFFSRARCRLVLRDARKALPDLDTVIALCDEHQSDYYRPSAHFLRAEALAMIGRTKEALAELACVPDGFSTWIHGPRSKQQLIEECERQERR